MTAMQFINHKKNAMLLAAGILSLMSCTDLVDEVEIPLLPPPIIVHAYLYPDMDTVSVLLHYAHSIGSRETPNTIRPIADAVVKINEKNNTAVILHYSQTKKMYVVSKDELLIKSGKDYFLTITHPASELIEASVTVPSVHNNFYAVVSDSSVYSYRKEYHLKVYVQDVEGENNYYQLFGFAHGITIYWDENGVEQEPFETSIFDYSPLLSDENRDGQRFILDGNFSVPRRIFPRQCESYPEIIRLKLYSFDKHAYNYQKSVMDFDDAIGNPFVEPVNIYTNLKNAYGVFGAFAWLDKEIPW